MSNIQIKNLFLEEVLTYKLVGIAIDQELTFDSHVESMFSKLAQLIGILWARYVLFFLELTVLLLPSNPFLCMAAPSGDV